MTTAILGLHRSSKHAVRVRRFLPAAAAYGVCLPLEEGELLRFLAEERASRGLSNLRPLPATSP